MTNFLPAGMINDSIEDIFEKILELKKTAEENDREKLMKGLNELESIALDLWAFIDQFPCQPIIYTGQGKTEELINRLEWALTLTDENDFITLEQRLKSGGNEK